MTQPYLTSQDLPVGQHGTIHAILDQARWAPSGDNAQNWRFEVVNEVQATVHSVVGQDDGVYDLHGESRWLSLGALLETMAVAASAFGLRLHDQVRPDGRAIEVHFRPEPGLRPDPLIPFIPLRSVQRRPLRTRPLTPAERRSLEDSLGGGHTLEWFSSWRDRLRMAGLMFLNAKLRLTLREAYEVHCRVIRWRARFSEEGLPDQALGASALTLGVMRVAMRNWRRLQFLNHCLAGTWFPRIEMDLIPSLACAAHVVIKAKCPPESRAHHISAGRAVQRFWLTATQLGLQQQPEITPLIFARYVQQGTRFAASPSHWPLAVRIERRVRQLLGPDSQHAVWLARIGHGHAAVSRSTRLPLERLLRVSPSVKESGGADEG